MILMKVKSQVPHRLDHYDVQADLVVMKNAELQRELIDAIPYQRSETFVFADIGAGTGGSTLEVLKRFVNARAVVIDNSLTLLAKAKLKLKKYSGRVTYLHVDARQWKPKAGTLDLVISGVTIHNLSHDEQRKLHEVIARAVKPGGYFINADFYRAETEEEESRRRAVYRAFLERNLSGPALKTWLHHAFVEDQPMQLSEQSISLQKSGFSMPHTLWTCENQIVYRVQKPVGKRVFFAMPFYGKTYSELVRERTTLHVLADRYKLSVAEQFIDIEEEGRYRAHDFDPRWVVEKDCLLIAASDYVVVDFSAPSIGRDCEMVIAKERYGKKLIAIVADSELRKHLWVRHYADHMVSTATEALDYVAQCV